MSAFRLDTHLGAYLFRENHFNKNGLVGFVTTEVLEAYLDASGKQSAATRDKIITVNGCLSTPTKWQAFDIEWQAALKDFGFKPEPKSGRYVFHATDFYSGFCKLSPTGLSRAQKQAIYDALIQIVRKHSLFLVGYATTLKDFAKFESEFPLITKFRFGKPGTFVAVLSVGRCMDWAGKQGYSKSISIMFDRGDEFWGEMAHGFQAYVKMPENEHLNPSSVADGNKAIHSPLQAADIVAWECRKYFKRQANIKVIVKGIKPHRELEMLRKLPSFFDLYQYADLKRRVSEIFPGFDIMEAEQKFKEAVEKRDEKLRLRKERRKARKENQQ